MPSGRFVYVLLEKQTGKQTGIGTTTETQMEKETETETEKATAAMATETGRKGERGNGE